MENGYSKISLHVAYKGYANLRETKVCWFDITNLFKMEDDEDKETIFERFQDQHHQGLNFLRSSSNRKR